MDNISCSLYYYLELLAVVCMCIRNNLGLHQGLHFSNVVRLTSCSQLASFTGKLSSEV